VWKRRRLNRGDLVFFKTTGARVGHAGIFIGHGRFIHASSSRGVRIDSIWDPYYYGPRFVGATRIPALRVKHRQRSNTG
jgi:cell wall-associated NlpC family hydrolase